MKNNPKGSGRKEKYNTQSTTTSFRVPSDQKDYIRGVVNRWLDKFKK